MIAYEEAFINGAALFGVKVTRGLVVEKAMSMISA